MRDLMETIMNVNICENSVEQLISEVPGISIDDQITLKAALQQGFIPNRFPDHSEMMVAITDLAGTQKVPLSGISSHEDIADTTDVQGIYLRYILLPKAANALGVSLKVDDAFDETLQKYYFAITGVDQGMPNGYISVYVSRPGSEDEFGFNIAHTLPGTVDDLIDYLNGSSVLSHTRNSRIYGVSLMASDMNYEDISYLVDHLEAANIIINVDTN